MFSLDWDILGETGDYMLAIKVMELKLRLEGGYLVNSSIVSWKWSFIKCEETFSNNLNSLKIDWVALWDRPFSIIGNSQIIRRSSNCFPGRKPN